MGNTPLHCASGDGKVFAARSLLAAGANKEARNNEGATALITAASFPDTDKIMTLLKAGLDIDEKDHRGRRTALMCAAMRFRADNVKYLLQAGANVSAVDRNGWTALDWAEKSKARRSWESERQATVVQLLKKVSRMAPA